MLSDTQTSSNKLVYCCLWLVNLFELGISSLAPLYQFIIDTSLTLQTYHQTFKQYSSFFVSYPLHSFISIQPLGWFSRNQSPVRRPVWLWHTASQASSQGQVAIAFSRLQTFPPSPLGAFTTREASSSGRWNSSWARNVPTNFGQEFDFHVILGIFYVPQICDMGQTALLPLRRKGC